MRQFSASTSSSPPDRRCLDFSTRHSLLGDNARTLEERKFIISFPTLHTPYNVSHGTYSGPQPTESYSLYRDRISAPADLRHPMSSGPAASRWGSFLVSTGLTSIYIGAASPHQSTVTYLTIHCGQSYHWAGRAIPIRLRASIAYLTGLRS